MRRGARGGDFIFALHACNFTLHLFYIIGGPAVSWLSGLHEMQVGALTRHTHRCERGQRRSASESRERHEASQAVHPSLNDLSKVNSIRLRNARGMPPIICALTINSATKTARSETHRIHRRRSHHATSRWSFASCWLRRRIRILRWPAQFRFNASRVLCESSEL